MTDSPAIGVAQRRIVDHLKRCAPSSTAEVAKALGVSTQAVRPQLAELEERGLVTAESTTTGNRGRPPTGWTLSPAAIDLFPDRHGDLTVELIDAIRTSLGDESLETVLAARDASQLQILRAAMMDEPDIEARAGVLAEHRSRQGYMAEVLGQGDEVLLVEHHCPVCAAASSCQGLCTNELKLFQEAMGPDAEVERTQHLLSGDERCVYRIRSREESRPT